MWSNASRAGLLSLEAVANLGSERSKGKCVNLRGDLELSRQSSPRVAPRASCSKKLASKTDLATR
eukprot:2689682-Alexandrium_andersonii.AAC.1